MQTHRLGILVADDDIDDLEFIEEAIRGVDPSAQVRMVKDGRSAIEYLRRLDDDELPGLIILDYNMPEYNGAEVLSIICKEGRYAAIPKVILTTSSHTKHIDECRNNGATAFFSKPNTQRELNAMMAEILAYRK